MIDVMEKEPSCKNAKVASRRQDHGVRPCNICGRSFLPHAKFIIFCDSCRKYNPHLNGESIYEPATFLFDTGNKKRLGAK